MGRTDFLVSARGASPPKNAESVGSALPTAAGQVAPPAGRSPDGLRLVGDPSAGVGPGWPRQVGALRLPEEAFPIHWHVPFAIKSNSDKHLVSNSQRWTRARLYRTRQVTGRHAGPSVANFP
jgi:hypothetical protein